MSKSFLNVPGLPIGLRNNNPGNLRKGQDFKGEIASSNDFAAFENIAWGLRALAVDLSTKIRNGYNTIEKIIYRYAPPFENDTENYIARVTSSTGFTRSRTLTADPETLAKLMRGIVNVELGTQYSPYIERSDIDEGINMVSNLPAKTAAKGAFIASGLLLGLAVYLYQTRPRIKRG